MTKQATASIGRRDLLKGCGALAAALAAAPLVGCASGSESSDTSAAADDPSSEDGESPMDTSDSTVTALNEVSYPEPISTADYDQAAKIREDNPLSDELLEGQAAFADNVTCYGIGTADTDEPNICLSPISLYVALSLLAQGAAGDTQTQLLDALGIEDAATLAEQCEHLIRVLWSRTTPDDDTAPSIMQVANSVWMRSDITVEPDFLTCAADSFLAECFAVDQPDSAAGKAMGSWIAKHTGGTLEPTFVLDSSWIMSLINTVWFKDGWTSPFDEDLTETDVFHAAAGDVDCDFMTNTIECPIVRSSGYQLAYLKLSTGATLTFLLPDEGTDPRSYLNRAAGMSKLFTVSDEESERARVTFMVPKLSFDTTVQMVDICEKMGITDVFSPDADLSALSPDSAQVSAVQQGTHFAMNEMGVEASAYTNIMMVMGIWQPEDLEEVEFRLDHPFAFRLTGPNGVVLFTGVVGDPSQG